VYVTATFGIGHQLVKFFWVELRGGLACLALRNTVTVIVGFATTVLMVARLIFVCSLKIGGLVTRAIIILIIIALIIAVGLVLI
jgi:hypothetical protein